MGIYIDGLFKNKRFSAPEGANREFRSACRSRNRRRAAGHDNAKSLLLMSPNRLARLHHCILRGTLAASFLLVLATAAFAQEPPAALADPVSAASSSVPRTDNATRIEIDQKAGVIRFVIRGEERAVLDDAGLHVNGDFEFTGQTEDIGEWSNREAANAP